MIGRLKGLVEALAEDSALIDVGGVCYEVFCSARTLQQLPPVGEATTVEIETHVREDHIHLYGFASVAEKEWFSRLQSVQGVGSKVALAILSILSPSEIAQAVAAQDKATVGRASGVGPKLATRIVNELKDKVPAFDGADVVAMPAAAGGDSRLSDAVSALVNLGFRQADAMGVVARVNRSGGGAVPVEELIRDGLKELSA
ncbi:MAG: Holliday junction branch migration protein RuvA [Alphaproteobacteria bacterium]